jgi:hypothetical protein
MQDYTLRRPAGARRYNDPVTLTWAEAVRDEFGHADEAEPVPVLEVYARVRRISTERTLHTFQQADVVGVEIEFRTPSPRFKWNGVTWKGHRVHTGYPEDVDDRGRAVRVVGWYQEDAPVQADPPAPEPPAPTPNETQEQENGVEW